MTTLLNYNPSLRSTNIDQWVLIPLVIILIVLAVIKSKEDKKLSLVVRSFFIYKVFRQTIREAMLLKSLTIKLLIFNALLGISLVIFGILPHSVDFIQQLLLFGIIMGGVVLWFLVKQSLVTIVGYITDTSSILMENRHYSSFYYQTIGILIIPGIIALYLFPNLINLPFVGPTKISGNLGLIYISCVMIAAYLIKLFQGIRQSSKLKISWYYIILYLCTLEIIPLVVIYMAYIGRISLFN